MKNAAQIKDNLHSLIDKIDNDALLELVYELLDSKNSSKEGELINSLSEVQRKELYESYEDSQDESNLIDLEQVRAKHSKWLEK
jgi:hypothetical protein